MPGEVERLQERAALLPPLPPPEGGQVSGDTYVCEYCNETVKVSQSHIHNATRHPA